MIDRRALIKLWLAALCVVLLGGVHALDHGLDTPDSAHVCTVCAHGPAGAAPSPGGALLPLLAVACRSVAYPALPDQTVGALPAAFWSRGPPYSFIA